MNVAVILAVIGAATLILAALGHLATRRAWHDPCDLDRLLAGYSDHWAPLTDDEIDAYLAVFEEDQ